MYKFLMLLITVMVLALGGCSSDYTQPVDLSVEASTSTELFDSTSEASTTTADIPDFRQVKWGMTKNEVKKYEGEPASEGPNSLTYHNIKFGNYNTTMFYEFNSKGQLCDGGYAVSELHTDMNQYINDYDSWKVALAGQYGTPTIDEPNWKTDAYENDRNKFGTAIVRGDLAMTAFWVTPTTGIAETLYGVDNDIVLSVSHSSRTIQKDN